MTSQVLLQFKPQYQGSVGPGCFWTDYVQSVEDCAVPVLSKPTLDTYVPPVLGRPEQLYQRMCPPPPGYSTPPYNTPGGQNCYTVPIYGPSGDGGPPPGPAESGGTGSGSAVIIGYQTVCT